MKKLAAMSLLVVFVLSIAGLSFAAPYKEPVKPMKPKIAIIPYINTTEETKDYIKEVIDENYTNFFQGKDLEIVPSTELQKALNESGFDTSNMELPEKDVFESVAKSTKADYVVAMEVSQLVSTKHMSFFQLKIETKAKLRYKFYNVSQDKLTSFQVTGDSENATVFGGVGYKEPISKALTAAMNKANEKISLTL